MIISQDRETSETLSWLSAMKKTRSWIKYLAELFTALVMPFSSCSAYSVSGDIFHSLARAPSFEQAWRVFRPAAPTESTSWECVQVKICSSANYRAIHRHMQIPIMLKSSLCEPLWLLLFPFLSANRKSLCTTANNQQPSDSLCTGQKNAPVLRILWLK